MQTQAAVERNPTAAEATGLVDRIWPVAVIALGLVLNAAWVVFLGYGFVRVLEVMF